VLVWFEPDFKARIENISKVVKHNINNDSYSEKPIQELKSKNMNDFDISKISFSSENKDKWRESSSFKEVL